MSRHETCILLPWEYMVTLDRARTRCGFLLIASAIGCANSSESRSGGPGGSGGASGTAGSVSDGGSGTAASGASSGGFAGSSGNTGDGSSGMAGSSDRGGAGGAAGGNAGAGADASGRGGNGGNGGVPPNLDECPDQKPEVMAPCSTPGIACRYAGECCPARMQCITNADYWAFIDECPPRCPATLPVNGSACNACTDLPTCIYDLCGSGGGIVTATCDTSAGTWGTTSASCESVPCGPQTCAPNQICVPHRGECVDNPCDDEPLSCACAGSACIPSTGYTCSGVQPRRINCTCQTC